jgi:hypothetical protein
LPMGDVNALKASSDTIKDEEEPLDENDLTWSSIFLSFNPLSPQPLFLSTYLFVEKKRLAIIFI